MAIEWFRKLRTLLRSTLGRSYTDEVLTRHRSTSSAANTSAPKRETQAMAGERVPAGPQSPMAPTTSLRNQARSSGPVGAIDTGQLSECDVVIGLDFGTSRTKVIVRTPDYLDERAVAVCFEPLGDSSNAHLLPARLWIDSEGICRLEASSGRRVEDIKIGLFESFEDFARKKGSKEKLDSEAIAVAYLTLVLQYTQAWFLRTQRDVIGHFGRFNWAVNLGVPSSHVGTSGTSRRFRRVGQAACMLWGQKVADGHVSLDMAEEALQTVGGFCDNSDGALGCDFEMKPEIVAAAVGYSHSDQRREGVHMMIDVGASTLDICTFLLHQKDGSDRYSLLTADVEFLGTFRLDEDGQPKLKADCDLALRRVIRALLPPNGLAAREDIFREHGRLPIFLTGGGSRHPFYTECVDDLEYAIQNSFRVKNNGIRRVQLPVPDTLGGEAGVVFHRLAVAWGLSYRAVDIGDVLPPEAFEPPDPLEPIPWEDRYLSKDDM